MAQNYLDGLLRINNRNLKKKEKKKKIGRTFEKLKQNIVKSQQRIEET